MVYSQPVWWNDLKNPIASLEGWKGRLANSTRANSSVFLGNNPLHSRHFGRLAERAEGPSCDRRDAVCCSVLPRRHVTVGLVGACFLAGCVAVPNLPSNEPSPPTVRPVAPSRIKPDTYPTTELRHPRSGCCSGRRDSSRARAADSARNRCDATDCCTTRADRGSACFDSAARDGTACHWKRDSCPGNAHVGILPIPAAPRRRLLVETYDLKQVIQQANDSYGKLDSYVARLTRREQINGKNKPEELMLFMFRKAPWSVHFKWLGTEGHDREVVYVNGQYESKIHTLLAAGDVPFMPAGKRMSLAPDSFLVKSAARYPITEAGMGASIDRIGAASGRPRTRRQVARHSQLISVSRIARTTRKARCISSNTSFHQTSRRRCRLAASVCTASTRNPSSPRCSSASTTRARKSSIIAMTA